MNSFFGPHKMRHYSCYSPLLRKDILEDSFQRQTFVAAASYAATGRGRAGLPHVGIGAMILPPRKRGVTQRRRNG